MAGSAVIKHKGIISEIEGSNVKVSILAEGACASCHAKIACGLGESKEKIIEVSCTNNVFTKGEEVMVCIEQSDGLRAVLFGYFLPFIILFTSLIILINLTDKEGLSALISIFLLAPYYFALYFFKEKLKKKFSFRIQKIN